MFNSMPSGSSVEAPHASYYLSKVKPFFLSDESEVALRWRCRKSRKMAKKSAAKRKLMAERRASGLCTSPSARPVEGFSDEYYELAQGPRLVKAVERLDPSPPTSPAKSVPKAAFATLSRSSQVNRLKDMMSCAMGAIGDYTEFKVVLSVECSSSVTQATADGADPISVSWTPKAEDAPEQKAVDFERVLRVAAGDVHHGRSTANSKQMLRELGGETPFHHQLATNKLYNLAKDAVGLVYHAAQKVYTLSLVAVLMFLFQHGALADNGVVKVVISGDGFAGSSRTGAVAVSARVLGMDPWLKDHGFTTMDSVFTLAYYAGTESRSAVCSVHKLMINDLALAVAGFDVRGVTLRAAITLCSDGKWLSNALGLTGGNAKMGCAWCYTNTQELCDDVYVERCQRDLTRRIDCHHFCHSNCRGRANNCKRPCKEVKNCKGDHGLVEVTPIASLIGNSTNVVPDILHMKLRLVERVAGRLRDELQYLYRTIMKLTIAETEYKLQEVGDKVLAYPPFVNQKKLRFHGDTADNFLSCGGALFAHLDLDFAAFPSTVLDPIRMISHLFNLLLDIVRSAYIGPRPEDTATYGSRLKRMCLDFSSLYASVMGRESKPLYLHVIRHHLAALAMKYGGLGIYSCEKVEKLNLILRRIISNRCGGGKIQYHTMRWSMTKVFLLSRPDLLPTVRAYKKRAASGGRANRRGKRLRRNLFASAGVEDDSDDGDGNVAADAAAANDDDDDDNADDDAYASVA